MTAVLLLLLLVSSGFGRIHRLQLEDDSRRVLAASSFGFLTGGILTVNLTHFKRKVSGRAAPGMVPKFGFTLDKSESVSPSQYDYMKETCILDNLDFRHLSHSSIRFSFDLEQNRAFIQRAGSDVQRLLVSDQPRGSFLKAHNHSQSNNSGVGLPEVPGPSLISGSLDLSRDEDVGYQTYFSVSVRRPEEEGQYTLHFHNCLGNHDDSRAQVTLKIEITEDNNGNFLTAGEMPVPALYFTFSVFFFIAGVAWLSVLRRSQEDVYKIHYLMLVEVFVKSLACLFHGVNMLFIQIYGTPLEVWAALWHIVSLTEGVMLVVTLVLMAVGWACHRSQLARKEKTVLLFAILFQLLHQVGEIIMQESEEGEANHVTWYEVALLADILCCAAILVPAVWTLRRLQKAFGIQGKAVVRPYTWKLFGKFYVLVVVYMYITRVAVYLLKLVLAFRYLWVSVLCSESASLLFFLLSGLLFRLAGGHFYTPVAQDGDDSALLQALQDGDNTCVEMPENGGDVACGLEPPDGAGGDAETEVDKVLAEKDKTGADLQPEGSTS